MSLSQRWQYKTLFVFADAERVREQLNPFAVEELPKYAPQALMPELDALGNEGWVLVHTGLAHGCGDTPEQCRRSRSTVTS